jgi:hypothetical protein
MVKKHGRIICGGNETGLKILYIWYTRASSASFGNSCDLMIVNDNFYIYQLCVLSTPTFDKFDLFLSGISKLLQ